jgi:hypothetical protein
MRASFRLSVVGLAVVVAVGFVALPASAGDPFIFKIAKKKSGPYSSEGVRLNIGPDGSKPFFLKARTLPGDAPQQATLSQASKSIYKTKYFKGDQNITQEVLGLGFEFTLRDKTKRFRGVVKDIGSAPDPSCIGIELETTSPGGVTASVNSNCF